MIESLDEIRGVGGKIKELLITYHGSEEEAIRSLWDREFERLIDTGVPVQKAMDIARFVESRQRGFAYADVAKTKEARELFNKLFGMLTDYPRTLYGKIAVGTFYPTLDGRELERRAGFVKDSMELARKLRDERKEIGGLLSKVSSLSEEEPRLPNLVATEDRELYDELCQKFRKKGNFLLVEGIEDLEYLRDFEFVRYVQRNSRFGEQAAGLLNVEPVYEDDMEMIIPELVTHFFEVNRECILSCIGVAGISGNPWLSETAGKLGPALEWIKNRGEGAPAEGRQGSAPQDIDSLAHSKVEEMNIEVSNKIRGMALKGDEVLNLLQSAQGSSIMGSLPVDFSALVAESARKCEDAIAEKLGIGKGLIHGLFNAENLPLEVDEERLGEIKGELAIEAHRQEFETRRRAAITLSKNIPLVKELVRKVLEFDLKLAVGFFCLDKGLCQTKVVETTGLAFNGGRNLFLNGEVQPVGYSIGSSRMTPGKIERATVITGANSGGKTTILELMAQVALMTTMGLGVPAENAECSLFAGVYYFKKSHGSDAGAFETLLKTFEAISDSSAGRRLVLADEIEAITEPGAAANIIVALLNWFKEDENTLITIVTHLGEDIGGHAGDGIRIDGIEATGLDEKLNLVVDRNPVLGKVAKSTPELIVERLSRTSSKKGFYKNILERFKG